VLELERRTPFEGQVVLYRTNAQSRLLEEAFRDERIPYQVVGAMQFYARKEIKDLLAYLRLAANPSDDISFRRAVNTPARGVGATTLETVEQIAKTTGLPLMEAAGQGIEDGTIGGRSAAGLLKFLRFVAALARDSESHSVAALLERIIAETDYEAYLDKAYPGMGAERMDNVRSLVSAAVEHAERDEQATLETFLDRTALVADADEVGARPGVTLMTIHCAKGLEYPVVFLAGLEEDLFPHQMAGPHEEDIEEERRLCYVAMTRARERLFLTQARLRRFQGALLPHRPSRFLDEIPEQLIDEVGAPPGSFLAEPPTWSGSSAARPAARIEPPPPPIVRVTPSPPEADGFDVGRHVLHPRFGDGKILAREGSGEHLKLTIHFGTEGTKKILPAYTRLKVEVR
jgi:DNA helicase II / ATP-dependent DNA helicase PcrA